LKTSSNPVTAKSPKEAATVLIATGGEVECHGCFLCERPFKKREIAHPVEAFENWKNGPRDVPITVLCCRKCIGYRKGFSVVKAVEEKLMKKMRSETAFWKGETK